MQHVLAALRRMLNGGNAKIDFSFILLYIALNLLQQNFCAMNFAFKNLTFMSRWKYCQYVAVVGGVA